MLKRILAIVGAVVILACAVLTTYMVMSKKHKAETEQLSSQIATLNAELEAIGPPVPCYTVTSETYAGQILSADMIQEQSIPSSMWTENFATYEDIIKVDKDGKGTMRCKVALQPGTPITKDMLYIEDYSDSTREMNITALSWPIGLREGDYVDLRYTSPMGEEFIVLSHKLVRAINNNTLQVWMTEEEILYWNSVLVDFYVFSEGKGNLYFLKYVEPNLQERAQIFYSIPDYVADLAKADPNIVDRAYTAVNQQVRDLITAGNLRELEYKPYGSSAWNTIFAARSNLNGYIMSDYTVWQHEYEEQLKEEEEARQNGATDESLIDQYGEGVG